MIIGKRRSWAGFEVPSGGGEPWIAMPKPGEPWVFLCQKRKCVHIWKVASGCMFLCLKAVTGRIDPERTHACMQPGNDQKNTLQQLSVP